MKDEKERMNCASRFLIHPSSFILSIKTPVGIEPTSTGLQPVAWPSGSSVIISPPGIEPDPRPSRGRVLSGTPRGRHRKG